MPHQRYSKKRQAILDYLRMTRAHPSAETVWRELKQVYPDLSLATVYRNLKELKEAGRIRSLGTVLGEERFDYTVEPHTHAVCSRCGRITDLASFTIPDEWSRQIQEKVGFTVTHTSLQLTGLCEDCRKKEAENQH